MQNYLNTIGRTEFYLRDNKVEIDLFINSFSNHLSAVNKIYIIGNGASCSMASHYAVDFTKNGGIPAESLNDGALLTCFANDFSFASSYSTMLKHKRLTTGDLLIAISSSGNSSNIINAVSYALSEKVTCLVLSGMAKDNLLQKSGAYYKLYSPGETYGQVEVAHNAWLHYILDKYIKTKEAK